MLIKNVDDARNILKEFETLRETAAAVANMYMWIYRKVKYAIEPEDIDVQGAEFIASYTNWMYGDDATEYFHVPMKWLFLKDNELEEVILSHIEDMVIRETKEHETKEALAEEAKRNQDYHNYLELKKKFEGDE